MPALWAIPPYLACLLMQHSRLSRLLQVPVPVQTGRRDVWRRPAERLTAGVHVGPEMLRVGACAGNLCCPGPPEAD